ncbi:TetR family transcriptional regulator [Actinoplanes sp. NPDC048967]|uniref:TetR family transcriptional regulator n=1 Tax=Actinoplanes sp. NPDC048967 TaxID=3155269 RepID=UPI0034005EB5
MVRDADDTRRRLLEAAATEFAERGIAGARVDRIAAAAMANKALIYSYFGNKEDLFEAVFHALVVDTVEDVPIDADDLPGYAARLFDRIQQQPYALRLALWHSLERGSATMPAAVVAANEQKVAAVAAAQRAGRISDRFPPGELLALVTGLSLLGSPNLALTHTAGPDGLAVRRRTVVESVRILTAKDTT